MSLGRRHGLVLIVVAGCRGSAPSPTPPTAASPTIDAARDTRERIVEVVAGPESTCARSSQGHVACVGHAMAYTEDKPAIDTHIPQAVPLPPSKAISAGHGFACSVDREGGKVRCRGDNRYGTLGRKSAGSFDYWPQEVPGLERIERIVSHGERTCALRADALWCWPPREGEDTLESFALDGRSPEEALRVHARLERRLEFPWSDGRYSPVVSPPWRNEFDIGCPDISVEVDEVDEMDDARDVFDGCSFDLQPGMEVGADHTCVLEAGRLRCAGSNVVGEVPGDAPSPVPVRDFAVGGEHTCVVTEDGELRCWGSSLRGQLGLQPVHSRPPQRVASHVEAAWVTGGLTCFRSEDGQTRCAGGLADPCEASEFELVSGPAGIVEMFDAFGSQGCAVDTQGSLWCFRKHAWVEHIPARLFGGAPASRTHFTTAAAGLCWLADGRPTCAPWVTPYEMQEHEELAAYHRERAHPLFREPDTSPPPPLGAIERPFGSLADAVALQSYGVLLCALKASGDVECLAATDPRRREPDDPPWIAIQPIPTPVEQLTPGGWITRDGRAFSVYGLDERATLHEADTRERRPKRDGKVAQFDGVYTVLASGELLGLEGDPVLEGVTVRQVYEGSEHACAVDDQNDLWCWGNAMGGRLGPGDPVCSRSGRSLTAAFHQAWEAAR